METPAKRLPMWLGLGSVVFLAPTLSCQATTQRERVAEDRRLAAAANVDRAQLSVETSNGVDDEAAVVGAEKAGSMETVYYLLRLDLAPADDRAERLGRAATFLTDLGALCANVRDMTDWHVGPTSDERLIYDRLLRELLKVLPLRRGDEVRVYVGIRDGRTRVVRRQGMAP